MGCAVTMHNWNYSVQKAKIIKMYAAISQIMTIIMVVRKWRSQDDVQDTSQTNGKYYHICHVDSVAFLCFASNVLFEW